MHCLNSINPTIFSLQISERTRNFPGEADCCSGRGHSQVNKTKVHAIPWHVYFIVSSFFRTLSYKNRELVVPTGYCWVGGDNHRDSADSNSFGPVRHHTHPPPQPPLYFHHSPFLPQVPLGLITAKATRIVWPPGRLQRIDFSQRDADRVRANNSYHSDVMTRKVARTSNSFTRVSV